MRKSNTFAAILLTMLIGNASAQAPNYTWVKGAGGTQADYSNDVCTDPSGNSIITGSFRGTVTFGTTTLTSKGSDDVFTVKYDPQGNVIWARSAGGGNPDAGVSVCAAANGHIIVTGFFESSTITFGTVTLSNTLPDVIGNGSVGPITGWGPYVKYEHEEFRDMFIVKYDPNGNVVWAKGAGGTQNDQPTEVSADPNGNTFVTGYFDSPQFIFTIGSNPITLYNYWIGNSIKYNDMFIVKYDPLGNVLWANGGGINGVDIGMGISADANGNAFVTGHFSGAVIIFGTTVLSNAGGYDVFVAKYDSNGNVLWAKGAGGTGNDWGTSISTDANGNAIVTGNFFGSASITFGTITLMSQNPSWSGTPDLFIVKYNPAGTVLWAKGEEGGEVNSVTADASGNIIMTGSFWGTLTFGTTKLSSMPYGPYVNYPDVFIAKWGTSGNVLWAKSAGGTLHDAGTGVAADASGNIVVTGFFLSASIKFGNTTLINKGSSDIFLVKLSSGGNGSNKNSLVEIDEDHLESGIGTLSTYPNPCSDQTTMKFVVAETGVISVDIYDISGRKVINLFEGTAIGGQEYTSLLNAASLSAGTYIGVLAAQGGRTYQKLVVH